MLHLHAVFAVPDVVRGLVHMDATRNGIKTVNQHEEQTQVHLFEDPLLLFLRFLGVCVCVCFVLDTHHPSSVPSHTELW